jgi:hypothetical protein
LHGAQRVARTAPKTSSRADRCITNATASDTDNESGLGKSTVHHRIGASAIGSGSERGAETADFEDQPTIRMFAKLRVASLAPEALCCCRVQPPWMAAGALMAAL